MYPSSSSPGKNLAKNRRHGGLPTKEEESLVLWKDIANQRGGKSGSMEGHETSPG